MEAKSKKNSSATKKVCVGVVTAIAVAALLAATVGFLIVKELIPQQWAVYSVPGIALCAVFLGSIAAGNGLQSAVYAIAVAGIYCAATLIVKLIFFPGPMVNTLTNVIGCTVGAVLGILCTAKRKNTVRASRKRR